MMYYPSQPCCAVCRDSASVWCQQDAAPLCHACDERIHSSGVLVSRHVRTALPGHEVERPTPPADLRFSASTATWDRETSADVHGAELRNRSTNYPNPVPDVYKEFEANQASMGTAPSFGSLELIQASVDDQPLLLATGDGLHKAPYPSLDIQEADATAVPVCPPGETHVPVSTEAAPNNAVCFAHVQPPVDTLTATRVAPQSAAAPARQQPPAGAQEQPVCQASTDAQPVFTPASQAPAFCLAPQPGPAVFAQAGGPPSSATMYTRTASQHNWQLVPAPVSYTAAMPGVMPMGWQMPTWMTYIPASLQPQRGSTDQASVERSQRQLARFHAKKQLLSCRKTVRYASRKIYADSRPRVHGRFIRKTDPAASLATTGPSQPGAGTAALRS